MRPTEFTGDQVSRNIQETFKRSDQERTEQLRQFSTRQNTQISLLQKERERLMQKYRNQSHPRIKKIEAKLRIANGLNQEFQTEFEKSQIEIPPFNRRMWRVQGLVLNRQRQGIEGLTVSLFDQTDKWVRAINFACTNERGYFFIDYPSVNEKPTIPSDQPLFLTVTNSDRQILHQEKTPLFIKFGLIDYREILLDLEQKNKTPPEPDRR